MRYFFEGWNAFKIWVAFGGKKLCKWRSVNNRKQVCIYLQIEFVWIFFPFLKTCWLFSKIRRTLWARLERLLVFTKMNYSLQKGKDKSQNKLKISFVLTCWNMNEFDKLFVKVSFNWKEVDSCLSESKQLGDC